MDIGDILEHPTPEMIENATEVWSEEHGQFLLTIPQETRCCVTGLTAGLLHELIPSVAAAQRKKNAQARIEQRERIERNNPGSLNNSPIKQGSDENNPRTFDNQVGREREREYLTGWEDENIQLDKSISMDVITDPLLMSNIVDTQVYDTLVEKVSEKRDSKGNVIQEAQFSLRREEKPHDNQKLGQLIRLVDPLDGQFFCPRTHRYEAPWEFIRWKELERKRSMRERMNEPEDEHLDNMQRKLLQDMVSDNREDDVDGIGRGGMDGRGGKDTGPLLTFGKDHYSVVPTSQNTSLSPIDMIRMSPQEALAHRQNMKMYKEQQLHMPKKGDQFPDVFLTLKRSQIPEEMFLPHTTHLSLSPDTELDKILKEGNLWAKVDQERLIGLKREEKVIAPLKHVTVMGELYRDFDHTIRLRGIWDNENYSYIEPVVTYKTRWEYCEGLDKQANQYLYGGMGCYSIGAYFALDAAVKIIKGLAEGD